MFGAQPHGSPQFGKAALRHEHYHIGSSFLRLKLFAGRIFDAEDVSRELDGGHLEAQTDAEKGNIAFSSDFRHVDFAFGAPDAEASRNQNAIAFFKQD